MDYLKIYKSLIGRGKNRKKKKEMYLEKHHIIPRCMGGNDSADNLSLLSGREHFVAHLLLVKIHPNSDSLKYALNSMLRSTNDQTRDLKSWEIGIAKQKYAEMMSVKAKLFIGDKNPNFGNYWTDEQKKALSQKKKGINCGDLNPSKRADVRKILKEGKLGEKNPNAELWVLESVHDGSSIEVRGGIRRFLLQYKNSSQFKCEKGTDPNWICKSRSRF